MNRYARCNDDCPDHSHTHINPITAMMYPSEVDPDQNVWTAPDAVSDYDPDVVVMDKSLSSYMEEQ